MTTMTAGPRRAAALLAALALLSACSSAPKRASEVVAKKNDAAEYAKLADGFFAGRQYASALQYYGEALEANQSVDNVEGAIVSRSSLGRVYLAMGQSEDAARELGDALEDARALGRGPLVALCLSNLGEFRFAQGDAAGADALFAEAEPLASGDDAIAAVISHNRGVVAMGRGDYAAAEAFLARAAASNDRARRWVELASNRYVLASVANAKGDAAGALAWLEKALVADKAAENSAGIGADLAAMARLQRRLGRDAAAFDLYRRAFGVWLAVNDRGEAEKALTALYELSVALGKESYALRYKALLERLGD